MSRVPHYLKHNKRGEQPSVMMFYDTETLTMRLNDKQGEAILDFGWLCVVRRRKGRNWSEPTWQRFETVNQFWDAVVANTRKQTKLYVFAHNQTFDFTVVKGFKWLVENGWKLTKVVIEGPPTIITARKDGRTICFLCTLNYFRMSLKKLGKAVNLEKLDYETHIKDRTLADSYCRRDVEITYKAIRLYLDILSDNDLGNFQPTLASQAMSSYRHRFMEAPIFIDTNDKALALARSSYYGGRTEALFIGQINEPLTLLDVNSMYPHVMATNPFPTHLELYTERVSLNDLSKWLGKWFVVADVSLSTAINAFPKRHIDRLVFPIGSFRTTLCGPELLAALTSGSITQIHSAAVYSGDYIFRKFVDFFYSKRQAFEDQGNTAFAFMCKIILNSLYGKFGQSGRVYETIGEADPNNVSSIMEWSVADQKVYHAREFAGVRQILAGSPESGESHPIIAAYVTAYARMYLYQLMTRAGWDNVRYVDTDSLLVTPLGLERLRPWLDTRTLGSLKVEYSFDNGRVYAGKDYVFGERVKIKGVREKATRTVDGGYRQPMFIGFRGMIQRGNLSQMIITDTVKHLTRQYTKGIVHPSGKVTPLVLDET